MSDDPNKTMGLIKDLYLAVELPAEVCLNIDVVDGLTNESPCVIKKFDLRVMDSTRCSLILVQFEDKNVGVVLHLGKRKQGHLHYVALSRCLNDMHVLKLNENKTSFLQKWWVK